MVTNLRFLWIQHRVRNLPLPQPRKMQLLSEDIQVFCVTHLAQVAAAADHHLLVSKRDDGALTTTSIQLLNDDQRVNELAQISSSSQSEASLQAARELLSVARR